MTRSAVLEAGQGSVVHLGAPVAEIEPASVARREQDVGSRTAPSITSAMARQRGATRP